jgi:hypothetical protein
MTRDEILGRLVTGAAYIERVDITKAQRDKAEARYAELEEELNRIKEAEKENPPLPEQVKTEMEKIREILRK